MTIDGLIESLNPKANRDSVFKSGEGAGQSGSFFFFSHDKKYIIKTMTPSELDLFLRILPDYEVHLKENPNSLLARHYGVYTVEMAEIATVHLILMANTLAFKDGSQIQRVFDLKGSLVDRRVKIDGHIKPTSCLKDLNFLQI